MRGKPKGIARKLAKNKETFMGKMMVSLFGEAGGFNEAQMLLELGMTPASVKETLDDSSCPLTPEAKAKAKKGMTIAHEKAKRKFQELTMTAALAGDFKYFERIAILMRLSSNKTTVIADELGTRILMIWTFMKLCGLKTGSAQVTEMLAKQFPRDSDYDEANVRKIMNNLGIPKRVNKT